MKKSILLLSFLITFFSSCEYVKPNYVGVQMVNYGKNGKSDFSIQKGKVSTLALGTELFQVPLFEQRADFGDRVLHLKAADNTAFSAKPIYSYTVIESRAVDVVFNNKQLGGGSEFMKAMEDNILEPKIYDILKEESRRYVTDSLMGNSGSLKFEEHVQKILVAEFEKKGLLLQTFSCQLEFSQKVTAKIDQRNEVNTNLSVLDQQIAEQEKKNKLALLKAQEQIELSKGITSQILHQQALEKWDGKLPTTIAGDNDIMKILLSK